MTNSPSYWQRFTRDIRIGLFAIGLVIGLTFILSSDLLLGASARVQLGLPANEAIDSPITKTYYSDYLTAEAQERAANLVTDVYTSMDTNIGRAQADRARAVFAFVDTVRADSVTDVATKVSYLQAIEALGVEVSVAEGLLTLPEDEYKAARANVLRSIEESMQEEIRESNLTTARRAARQRVSFDLNRIQETIVQSLAPQFVVPNIFFDDIVTSERRAAAREAVEPVAVTVTKDEQIVRVGVIVDAFHIEMLEELNLLQPQTSWWDVAALFIAVTLFTILLSLYWLQFHAHMPNWTRHLLLLATLLFVFTFAAKLMMEAGPFVPYLMPMAALSMLLAVIFEARLSLFATTGVVGLVALATDSPLEMVAYMLIGGTLAVLVMQNVHQINVFFRAGLISAFGNVAIILIFHLQPDAIDPFTLMQLVGLGFINGLFLAASLTVAGLFLAGSLFGVVTTLQLQELSRLDHPLLQELLRRAPGTYHHSIMVANLAEQAAERIKANSTLVRVGAFYHDIGKISRPPFYTENQEGINPHDTMDAYESARIIIGHVTDGLELARQYRLPMRVQEFIASHHGTRLVRAFHAKAVAQAGDNAAAVDAGLFQYPGPVPHSREMGVVLLADAIDAVSNALRPNTLEAIERLVNSIVDEDLKAGQLDYSGLTLADIKAIRASFIETLQGRFHVRIKYPGNEKLENPEDIIDDHDGVVVTAAAKKVVAVPAVGNEVYPQTVAEEIGVPLTKKEVTQAEATTAINQAIAGRTTRPEMRPSQPLLTVLDANQQTELSVDAFLAEAAGKPAVKAPIVTVGSPSGKAGGRAKKAKGPAASVTEPLPAEPVVAEPVVAESLPAEPVVAESLPAEPVVAEPLPAESLPAEPLPAESLPAVAGTDGADIPDNEDEILDV